MPEERNFTRAAVRLQITAPALSRTVAGLERLVGVTLLRRDRRMVQLTPVATRFLQHTRRLLTVAEEARSPRCAVITPSRSDRSYELRDLQT